MSTTSPLLEVAEISSALQIFGWADYLVFVTMLFSCTLIGVYYGFKDSRSRKQRKGRRGSAALDYLVGGRKMKVFPVTVSLVASWISGISLLGTATEIYIYGTGYMFVYIAFIAFTFVVSYVFLPVYHELQLTSAYEYLEARFSKKVRLFGSILYSIGTIVWLPIVIYVPALAFNQVTGINIHVITPIVCFVCIFYTFLGGLKAVVWTDVIQTFIMVGAMILIIIKGTIDIGGISVLWKRNWDSGRIEGPLMDFDFTERHTIWALFFGGGIYWLQSNTVNQSMIQRFLSLPNLKSMRIACFGFLIGTLTILLMCCYSGLLIYATYHDCDPLTTKLAKAKDQLLPLLVMDILGKFPGLPGLFVAGVFSAALSSMSTALNAMAAVVLEDFYKPFASRPLSEKGTMILVKSVVFIIGVSCIGLVFIVEHLGNVLQLSMSVGTISGGPLFGIFIMGLMFPWVTSTGALTGGISGLSLMIYINYNTQLAIARGEMVFETKPMTTEGCTYEFNPVPSFFQNTTDIPIEKDSNPLFHLSYMVFILVGTLTTIIIGNIASLCLGRQNINELDLNLLAPFVRRYVKKKPSLSYQPDLKEQESIIHAFEITNT